MDRPWCSRSGQPGLPQSGAPVAEEVFSAAVHAGQGRCGRRAPHRDSRPRR